MTTESIFSFHIKKLVRSNLIKKKINWRSCDRCCHTRRLIFMYDRLHETGVTIRASIKVFLICSDTMQTNKEEEEEGIWERRNNL